MSFWWQHTERHEQQIERSLDGHEQHTERFDWMCVCVCVHVYACVRACEFARVRMCMRVHVFIYNTYIPFLLHFMQTSLNGHKRGTKRFNILLQAWPWLAWFIYAMWLNYMWDMTHLHVRRGSMSHVTHIEIPKSQPLIFWFMRAKCKVHLKVVPDYIHGRRRSWIKQVRLLESFHLQSPWFSMSATETNTKNLGVWVGSRNFYPRSPPWVESLHTWGGYD